MPSLLDLAYHFMPEAPDQFRTIPPGMAGGWPRQSADWGIGDEMRWQTAEAQNNKYTPMGGGGIPINAANWQRFLAQQTPASRIEDQRGYIQPTDTGEGQWPMMYPRNIQQNPMAAALGAGAIAPEQRAFAPTRRQPPPMLIIGNKRY